MRVEQLRDLKLSEDNCDALDVSYFYRTSEPARTQLLHATLSSTAFKLSRTAVLNNMEKLSLYGLFPGLDCEQVCITF